MNKCFFSGNVTRDPEVRYMPSGTMLTKFSIAVNSYKNVNGERQKYANFFDFEAWGQSAEFISKYVKKGDHVDVEASAYVDKWKDSEGVTKSKIVFRVDSVEAPKTFRGEPVPVSDEDAVYDNDYIG